jgi:hypothetical protein
MSEYGYLIPSTFDRVVMMNLDVAYYLVRGQEGEKKESDNIDRFTY